MHILEGLGIAVDNIDAVIDLIRASKDTETARLGLMSSFELSPRQAQAILDMRLAKLTGLEREALIAEIKEVGALIAQLEEILGSEAGADGGGHRRARGGQARSTATSAAPRSSTTRARSTSRT